MKIYRTGHTSENWGEPTDEKIPDQWPIDWKPGSILSFDGTIDKAGDRHTSIGVSLDSRDIVTAMNKLFTHLQQENGKLRVRCERAERGLVRILNLSYSRHAAPSQAEFDDAIFNLSWYYSRAEPGQNEPVIAWEITQSGPL